MRFSDFCGMGVCKNCVNKQREFPACKGERGNVCLVCDRKFYAKEWYDVFAGKVDVLNEVATQLEGELREHEDDYKTKNDNLEKIRKDVSMIA